MYKEFFFPFTGQEGKETRTINVKLCFDASQKDEEGNYYIDTFSGPSGNVMELFRVRHLRDHHGKIALTNWIDEQLKLETAKTPVIHGK
jgi:hypothetical protein